VAGWTVRVLVPSELALTPVTSTISPEGSGVVAPTAIICCAAGAVPESVSDVTWSVTGSRVTEATCEPGIAIVCPSGETWLQDSSMQSAGTAVGTARVAVAWVCSPAASVTLTVSFQLPVVWGLPVTLPAASLARPAGSPVTEYVYGGDPPVATR
jgi:hypothetical protein